MPPTPAHTSRAGDGPDWTKYDGVKLPSLEPLGVAIDALIRSPRTLGINYRDRVATLAVENHHLAALLDGVMADDPAAVRDAAAWLAANRPEVDG